MVTLILLSRLIIGMIIEYTIYIYNYSRIFMEPFENFLLYMIQVTVHDEDQCAWYSLVYMIQISEHGTV